MTTNASGNSIAPLRYAPWGEVRSGTSPPNYTFTGQYSNVSDLGLMFYNARWYDPALSRFTSADTIVAAGAMGLDRYAYANDSPLVFTDPTGHFGNRDDERSDYWNRRNQQRVRDLEEKWRAEEAAKALLLLRSWLRQTWKELALDPTMGVAGAFGGGKPLFGMGGQGEPPPGSFRVWGSALEIQIGLIAIASGFVVVGLGATVALVGLAEAASAVGISAASGGAGLLVVPHAGMTVILGAVTGVVGIALVAGGGYLVYDGVRTWPHGSTLYDLVP